jgi:hypothetical protein
MSSFRLFGKHAALSLALASALVCTARADTVTEWNRIMQETVTASGGTPASNPNHQTRWGAIVQLAVFEAVNSIDRSYEPYIAYLAASPNASLDAAVITAAHDTLVVLRPNSTATLDGLRNTALDNIPNGPNKDAGIAVGAAAAVAMLALRADDGWNDIVPYTPGSDPGDWRPIGTQTPVLPGWGLVTPFGIESGSHYRLQAPPALQTEKYAAAYNEVKLLGRIDSAVRSLDRTNVAKFYASASPVYVFNAAARQVTTLSLTENARVFALLAMAMADASVAAWDTKYHYNFWRPQAAIQNGDLDGNPLTEADSTWLPLISTPAHPSYASGHATVSGSARAVLEWAFGKDGHEVSLTHSAVPGFVLIYNAWDEITDDVDDARIYGGIHFSFDQEKGAHQGRQVGKYILKNLLPPADEDEE